MDAIVLLKQQIWELEKAGRRFPIYQLLRDEWSKEANRTQLALLVLQQMAFFLEDLEDPRKTWQQDDDYDLYHSFLQEALAYGMEHCLQDKMFLWQMCFWLEGLATYHYLVGEIIPWDSAKEVKERLYGLFKKYYPESKLSMVIRPIVKADYLWLWSMDEHDKSIIASELAQWNLQSNGVDEEIKEVFEDTVFGGCGQTEPKAEE